MNRCKYCNTQIEWAKTKDGKSVPLETGEWPARFDDIKNAKCYTEYHQVLPCHTVSESDELGYAYMRIVHDCKHDQ